MTSVIVIGAGLAGSSAAWRLAEAGHDVTVLERGTPANALGSSHGSARIFRYAYPSRTYVDLVVRAAAGWDVLAAANGAPLVTPTGAADFGATRDPAHLADVLADAGVEHSWITASDARERWGIAADTDVLWHPGAGVIDAERAVEAMLAQAVAAGARVVTDWPVASVTRTATGYRATRAPGTTDAPASFDAEQVVVAAGGWLPDLLDALALPDGYRAGFPELEVRQEQAYHFPYRDPSTAGAWPTFIHKSPEIQVYGLPGGRDADHRGQKVAEYNGGKRIPSAAHHDQVVDPANRQRVIEYVERSLPGLVPEPYAETTCLFTNTPDEDFVIDRVEGITVLSPCSGHGAKFAPILGSFVLDLVEDRPDQVPALFRPGLAVAR